MTEYKPFSRISGLPDGPAVLLLNSLGTTTQMWSPQLPLLEKHYRVVQMDTRGHGQSPTPPAPYSFDLLIGDAFGVMDSYDISSFSVMGCSLGSMTALGMGVRNPERVAQIVCAAARADAPAPFRQSWDDRMAVIDEKGVSALWEGSLGNWLTPTFRDANPQMVETMKSEFHKTTPEGYRGCAMALKQLDMLKDLPGMKVPTLFVAGEHDKGAPPATMREMSDATPGSVFALVSNAGHIINVNNPEGFNLAVTNALNMGA